MNLMYNSVLVMGGAGFIGSHVVDEIIKKSPKELVVVDDMSLGSLRNLKDAYDKFPKLKVLKKSAINYDSITSILEKYKIDVVFNLAVRPLEESLDSPVNSYLTNVTIVLYLCELLRGHYYKTLIHVSSSEVYGTSVRSPMKESHPLNGITPYAASKASGDLLILSYIRTFGIDASIVRPFNTYGPRQNSGLYSGIIPKTITRILKGDLPIISGTGKQIRDFTYVTDIVRGIVRAYEEEITRGQVINLASGTLSDIGWLIKTISWIMGKEGYITEKRRKGDVNKHCGDPTIAYFSLRKWSPKMGFNEGIRKTIDYYREEYKQGRIK